MIATPTAKLSAHSPTTAETSDYLPLRLRLVAQQGMGGDADIVLFAARVNDARRFFIMGFVGASTLHGDALSRFLSVYDEDCIDGDTPSESRFLDIVENVLADAASAYTAMIGRHATCENWRSFRETPERSLPYVDEVYARNGRDTRGNVTLYNRPDSVN